MIEEQIAGIKEKIARKLLRLYPCLSLTEIEAFETKCRVTLPTEYRRFLLEIGNGGAGPSLDGMWCLGEVPPHPNAEYRAVFVEEMQVSLQRLREPFPFHEAWIWEDEDWAPGELGREFGKLECGNLRIGDEGCGMFWHLIVTGRERGKIWQFTDVGISSEERNFLDWYENWLDTKQ